MRPLSDHQLDFLVQLNSACGGLTIDIEKYLSDYYFTSETGRALILQPTGGFGFFYLIPSLFESTSTRNKVFSDFISVVVLLDALRQAGQIYYIQTPVASKKETAIQALSDSFETPHINAGKISLNTQGDYTSHPETIKNKDNIDIYHGIKFEGSLFDVVNAVVRGVVYLTADIAGLIETSKNSTLKPNPVRSALPVNKATAGMTSVYQASTHLTRGVDQTIGVSNVPVVAKVEPVSKPSTPAVPVPVAQNIASQSSNWGSKSILSIVSLLLPLASWTTYQVHEAHSSITNIKKIQSDIQNSVVNIGKHLNVSSLPTAATPVSETGLQIPVTDGLKPSTSLESSATPTDTTTISPVSPQNATLKFGFDLSKWNGDLAAKALATPHVGFIIVRATSGMTKDSDFDTNWALIQRNKVARGAYHFYVASEDPISQAKHFLSTIGNIDKNPIPPIVDFEELSLDVAPQSQTVEMIQARLLKTLTYIETQTKQTPILYTNVNAGNKYLADARFSRFPLWIADWTSKESPTLPMAWKSVGFTFWQRSSSYTLSGGNAAPIDMDIYKGNSNQVVLK
jgi:GH25 family lysozyme M1 (1,4-beta-N-acetylmuramidase)